MARRRRRRRWRRSWSRRAAGGQGRKERKGGKERKDGGGERGQESERKKGEAGRGILTNWKAVKPKARRRRAFVAKGKEVRRFARRARLGPGKRRAARHSCQDDPRLGIFRAEIKSGNVHRRIFAGRALHDRRWSPLTDRPPFSSSFSSSSCSSSVSFPSALSSHSLPSPSIRNSRISTVGLAASMIEHTRARSSRLE